MKIQKLAKGVLPPVKATNTLHCPVSNYGFLVVQFGSIWFSHDFINCLASDLLLYVSFFYKKLIIWDKMSLTFWQTDNPRFSFIMRTYLTDLSVYTWREIGKFSEISFLPNQYHHDKDESLLRRGSQVKSQQDIVLT